MVNNGTHSPVVGAENGKCKRTIKKSVIEVILSPSVDGFSSLWSSPVPPSSDRSLVHVTIPSGSVVPSTSSSSVDVSTPPAGFLGASVVVVCFSVETVLSTGTVLLTIVVDETGGVGTLVVVVVGTGVVVNMLVLLTVVVVVVVGLSVVVVASVVVGVGTGVDVVGAAVDSVVVVVVVVVVAALLVVVEVVASTLTLVVI